jgi:hypothetical protein
MLAARRLARTLAQSRGFDAERLLSLLRRLLQEPKAQDLGLGIAADISERLVSRIIRGLFQLPDTGPPPPSASSSTSSSSSSSYASR